MLTSFIHHQKYLDVSLLTLDAAISEQRIADVVFLGGRYKTNCTNYIEIKQDCRRTSVSDTTAMVALLLTFVAYSINSKSKTSKNKIMTYRIAIYLLMCSTMDDQVHAISWASKLFKATLLAPKNSKYKRVYFSTCKASIATTSHA